MKIKSVLEFVEWLSTKDSLSIYRGHSKEDWFLEPSITRYVRKFKNALTSTGSIEEELLLQFGKFATPYKDYRERSYLEKLIDAQHFGLPTRLLDWTTNPLKALYFAVEDPKWDTEDAAVYSFIPEFWWDGTKNLNKEELDEKLITFYPEIVNERLGAQEGCFVSFPLIKQGSLPLTLENYPDDENGLDKIIIEAGSRMKFRSELNKFGINQRTIYPGLEGVAKWVKSHVSDYRL